MQIFVTASAILSLTYAAGLNGSMSLAVLLLLAKLGNIQLGWPLGGVSDAILFGVLIPLAFVEIWINKIQFLLRISDYVQVAWRGLVAAAITVAFLGTDSYLAIFAVGTFLIAAIMQIIRIVVRPFVVSTTHGIGLPVMSMLEDLVAVVTTILAVHVPFLALAFAITSGYMLLRAYRRIRERHFMREAAAMLPAISVAGEPMPPRDKDPDEPENDRN